MYRPSRQESSRSEFSEDDGEVGQPAHASPASMRTVIVGCALVAVFAWLSDGPKANAQAVLDAPPCESARRDLDAALAQKPTGADEQVRLKIQIEKTRGIVAQRCFGREADSAVKDRAARAAAQAQPAEVGPVRVAPLPPATPAVVAPAPPALEVARPTFTTVCDPGGCWDSSGARLNGPPGGPMTGPRGTCTASAGGVVSCF